MNQSITTALADSIAKRLFGRAPASLTEPIDDNMVLEKVREGESEAFGILVSKYERYVFTIVKWIVESDDLAADVSQEVFLRAYRGIRRFEQRANFKTWLYKIAYNTALNSIKIKNQQRGDYLNFQRESAICYSIDPALRMTLDKLIKALRPEYRTVIVLHYYGDMKYEEIAEIMGCPVNTVKIWLFQGKRKLRELWDRHAA